MTTRHTGILNRHKELFILAASAVLLSGSVADVNAAPSASFEVPCTILGTPGNDTLIGTAGDDVICGLDGADTIEGLGGNDLLIGGPGNDFLAGNAGDDELFGHAGEDTLFGGPGDDLLAGGGGADTVRGGGGNDELHGGAGADLLVGGDGQDELWGGPGADTMEGRTGADRLRGGTGNDLLAGNAGDDRLFGEAGEDTLRGGPGQDVLGGGGDADLLRGGNDNDELDGEAGDDTLVAGSGDDLMWGGPGMDLIEGRAGNDTLRGGADDDTLAGNEGDDVLIGESGDDKLFGGNGIDNCYGGSGTNQLVSCTQLGGDILGEASNDRMGWAVAMSADGRTVIFGSPYLHDNDAAGHARIFRLSGATWMQVGDNIVGDNPGDAAGRSVAMSDDGQTVIVGATHSDGNGENSGGARIYHFDGTSWVQVGDDIDGVGEFNYFGSAVDMSADGNTVLIGSPYHDANGDRSGYARAYRFDGSVWQQLGSDLVGAASDSFGHAVAISDDGTTIVIGAPHLGAGLSQPGKALVYRYDGAAWQQLGAALTTDAGNSEVGSSLAISNDGNVVAVGFPRHVYSEEDTHLDGHVRVYRFDGTTWVQVGHSIGEGMRDNFGYSIAMDGTGGTIIVGAASNSDRGIAAGHALVFHLDGAVWTQVGRDFDGEAYDSLGTAVTMSDDGMTVMVTAWNYGEGESRIGRAQIFELK